VAKIPSKGSKAKLFLIVIAILMITVSCSRTWNPPPPNFTNPVTCPQSNPNWPAC
jgi:hypothetical protein